MVWFGGFIVVILTLIGWMTIGLFPTLAVLACLVLIKVLFA